MRSVTFSFQYPSAAVKFASLLRLLLLDQGCSFKLYPLSLLRTNTLSPSTYITSVYEWGSVDNKIETFEKKWRKWKKASPRDSSRRSQKTIYRQDLQDLHRFLSFSFHNVYPVYPVYFQLIIPSMQYAPRTKNAASRRFFENFPAFLDNGSYNT